MRSRTFLSHLPVEVLVIAVVAELEAISVRAGLEPALIDHSPKAVKIGILIGEMSAIASDFPCEMYAIPFDFLLSLRATSTPMP
jgi:hypothetical protein